MANLKLKRSENVDGNFYVDESCINCGTCYWVAPSVFELNGTMSAVKAQPEKKSEATRAYRALYSCPTNSIGVEVLDSLGKKLAKEFPYVIDENVYHTGFHAESSYGAASYFIKAGLNNILIDSPRYNKALVTRMLLLGGVEYQLLTHKDDVADTDLFWKKFKTNRIIHQDDITDETLLYESYFQGEDEQRVTDELIAIPVPGHTKGSVCFLYKERYLFTGDHLAYSPELDQLYAFKRACWYDFEEQIKSMKKLLDYKFEWILPGHGFPYHASPEKMKEQLEKCIEWMQE